MQRLFFCSVLIASSLVPLLAFAGRPDAAREPDILFISLDTVRSDFLTFRDPEASPRMTALAEQGTIFRQAISGTSWTLPAHVQMFTGTPPTLHGVESDHERIDPKMPLLSELLHRAGYFTAGFFTVRYLWGDYGFDRGFDIYRSAMYAEDLITQDIATAPRGAEAVERARRNEKIDFITSPNVVRLARSALERANPKEPIFVFAHFFDPHHDFIPPSPWDEKFDPNYEGDIDGRGFLSNKRIYDPKKSPKRQIGERDLDHIKALYRGEIAWTDHWVGKLLDLFALHGRLEDTLIVITADHGEEFFEHGNHFHRRNLYEELVRVPLLIVPPKALRTPGIRELGGQVSLSDILPTIVDFAGIDLPERIHGQSLRSAMRGEEFSSRPLVLSLYHPAEPARKEFKDSLLQVLRTPEYKFMRRTMWSPNVAPKSEVVYFDLEADPGERVPIIDPGDRRVVAAWHVLEDELDGMRESWRAGPRSPDAERRTDVRETFEEELLALGYIEDVGARDPEGKPRPWGGLEPMARIEPLASGPSPILVSGVLLSLLALGLLLRRWLAPGD